jgi:xanthine dehydrogenase iron-sulfur cluster and FAD-binding subunit A
VRLEPGTTKNGEGRAFPLIPELRALLERRQSITRRCERAQGETVGNIRPLGHHPPPLVAPGPGT